GRRPDNRRGWWRRFDDEGATSGAADSPTPNAKPESQAAGLSATTKGQDPAAPSAHGPTTEVPIGRGIVVFLLVIVAVFGVAAAFQYDTLRLLYWKHADPDQIEIYATRVGALGSSFSDDSLDEAIASFRGLAGIDRRYQGR